MLSLAVSLLGAPTSAARSGGGGGGRGGGSVVSMFLFAGHMILTTWKNSTHTSTPYTLYICSHSFIRCLSYYPKDNLFVFYRYGILDDLLRRFSCLSSFRSSRSAIF